MIIDLTKTGNVSLVYLCNVKKAKAAEDKAAAVCANDKKQAEKTPDTEVVLKQAA